MSYLEYDFKIKLDYKDILIVPSSVTEIRSRKEIFPYYELFNSHHLPLITAPMDTVVDSTNAKLFTELKINVCLPRGEKILSKNISPGTMQFESISLQEFENMVSTKNYVENYGGFTYLCIDIANGHMESLHQLIATAKKDKGKKLVIMAGNIANPHAYIALSQAGADFIRVGIGNGNGCLTTEQTGIGFPAASLIRECYAASLLLKNPAKIVADGGIKSYSDILKALALGANYVMAGSTFNKSLESCADTTFCGIKIDQYGWFANWLFKNKLPVIKNFRGMSTKEVQKKWGRKELKTSEGITKKQAVEYTITSWSNNFKDYLCSNMSYCNCKTLSDYIGNPQIIEISNKAYERFHK